MKKVVIFIFLISFLTGSFSFLASADELYLKNGRIIRGVILKRSSGGVIIELKIGRITYPASQVDKVAMASARENEELRSHWRAEKEARQIEEAEEGAFAVFENSDINAITEDAAAGGRIYTKGDRIYVNDELFFIKGVAYGINYPGVSGGMAGYHRIPSETFKKDFEMMEKAGINCIRTYEPLPPELLDLAEKHNIMVVENIVYPGDWTNYKSDKELKSLIEEAVRIIKRDKDRPCILMWSIWNDAPFTWGSCGGNVVERYGFETVNKFLKEIYLAVKAEDGQHPVTGSNMLDQPGTEVGFDFLDVIGLNAYIGGHGQWLGVEKATETVKQLVEISKEYNKPVVILETGYSTYVDEELQYEVLKKQIEITNRHIAGLIIFQWTDGWWKAGKPGVHDKHIEEYWGILTGYREPKIGYKAVSEMFNKIDTNSKGYAP